MDFKQLTINLIILTVVAGASWVARGELSPKIVDRTVTDTVRVDVPYEVEVIKEVEKPVTVTEYVTKYDTVQSVKVVKDTVFIETTNNDLIYNTTFLTQFADAPKFLGLNYSYPTVELTYFTPNGNTKAQTWEVNNYNYRIGLNDGSPSLTSKKRAELKLTYSAEAGAMYFIDEITPYLEFNGKFIILDAELVAGINVNQNPFAKLGIQYEF